MHVPLPGPDNQVTMKRFDVRLAVGTMHCPRSSVWNFWSRNDQVYVAHGNLGGVEKFSFHTPDIYRLAFTKEHGTPVGVSNRASHQWRRDLSPPPRMKQVVPVLRVNFATDVLSTALAAPKKPVSWIDAAPVGHATVVDLMFTRESEQSMSELSANGFPQQCGFKLICYKEMSNEEAFLIASWFSTEAANTLRMPAENGAKHDLIILPIDPNRTGRPVRLTVFSDPKDGDIIQLRIWRLLAFPDDGR
jgi:hypothetical protein